MLLIAVKPAILPVPLAPRPIEGWVFIQLYTIAPPVVGLVKFTAAVFEPAHTVWLATAFTVAVGLTVIVKLTGTLVQLTPPLVKVAVTVIVPVIGPVVPLVAVKARISPVPLAGRPIAGFVFIQLYTSPG